MGKCRDGGYWHGVAIGMENAGNGEFGDGILAWGLLDRVAEIGILAEMRQLEWEGLEDGRDVLIKDIEVKGVRIGNVGYQGLERLDKGSILKN